MGYPQFNKVTIQLPLPDSTMTKAEYKDAYGIDLDAINFPKVTLLVDGDNKYLVDEVKIVSDDVLIFAGGKILIIGDDGNVSVITGAYSVENAKPIYYHPIFWQAKNADSTKSFQLNFVIFDNQKEAYTLTTFLEKIEALMDLGAYIQSNGYILISSSAYPAYLVLKIGSTYRIAYTTPTGAQDMAYSDFDNTLDFKDGVNKIN